MYWKISRFLIDELRYFLKLVSYLINHLNHNISFAKITLIFVLLIYMFFCEFLLIKL